MASIGGTMAKKIKGAFGKGRLLGLVFMVAALGLFVADHAFHFYPLEFMRLKIFDFYQKTKPREVGDRFVTIIDIDEASLTEIGQWPWPRTVVARLVEKLTEMGAVLVAFDIVFAEPDRMSPASVADTLKDVDPATRERLKALRSNEEILAEAMRKSRVVLGQATYWDERPQPDQPPVKKSVAFRGPPPGPFIPSVPSLVRNLPVLEQAAAGHGIFSLEAEIDHVVRRVPTLTQYKGEFYPALSVEMLRVATNRATILATTNEGGVTSLGIQKGLIIPTDSRGRVWPYFSRSDQTKYVPARDILNGTADPAKIAGKLTILGTSAVGLRDIRSTPVDADVAGVEVHAQVIETALTGAYLSRPNDIIVWELLVTLLGCLLMIVLVPMVGAKWTLLLFLAVAGGSAYASWHLFATQLILFDASYATLSILLVYMLLTYAGYAAEEAQRRQVRSAFGYYLSPAMVERLAEDPSHLKLGGEKRDMTMLFCDVRGFTTISEMFDAVGLTKLINKLLTPLTGIILDRQGTVDKYMGDCIMAFWNAPLDDANHARNACLSALAMNARMATLDVELEAEAKAEGRRHVPLKVGIGVNSGEVVVGNMGSDQRFDYSVLGDNVNLASRLEGQCKTYAVDIVIGENTQARAPDLAVLELDLIKVKGKHTAVRIFTVIGDEQVNAAPAFQAFKKVHDEMLAAYRGQRWAEARAKIDECRRLASEGQFSVGKFYDVMEERIGEYEQDSPGADWDGVFVAKSK